MTDTTTTPVTNVRHADDVALFGSGEKWTVKRSRSLESFADVKAMMREARAEDAKGRKYGTQATIANALVTHAAIRTGYIFDGRGARPEGTVSKGDYGVEMGYTSGAIVSKWITVGNLLVNCGLDPFAEYLTADGQVYDLWNILVNKSGLSKVRELAENSASVDEIIAHLLTFFSVDGKRIGANTGAHAPASEKEETDKETPDVEGPEVTRPQQIVLTLMAVRDAVKSLGVDEMSKGDAQIARDTLAEIAALLDREVEQVEQTA